MGRKKILIIEDDPDILELLSIIFCNEGYEVVLSATGEEAPEIHNINPDLVLLDVMLKNAAQNGAMICAGIKSHPVTQKLPVILLSAELDLFTISQQCGADACITKPFNIKVLCDKVKEFLTK